MFNNNMRTYSNNLSNLDFQSDENSRMYPNKDNVLNYRIDDYIENKYENENINENYTQKITSSKINFEKFLIHKSNSISNKIENKNLNLNNTMENRYSLKGIDNAKPFENKKTTPNFENNIFTKIKNNINFFNEKNKNNIINDKIMNNIRNSNKTCLNDLIKKITNNKFDKESKDDDFSTRSEKLLKDIKNEKNSRERKKKLAKLETKKNFNFSISNNNLTYDRLSNINLNKENKIFNLNEKEMSINNRLDDNKNTLITGNNLNSEDLSSNKVENEISINNLIQSKEFIKKIVTKKTFSGKVNKFLNIKIENEKNMEKTGNIDSSSTLNTKKNLHLKRFSNKISDSNYINKKLEKVSFNKNSNKSRLSIFEKGNYEDYLIKNKLYFNNKSSLERNSHLCLNKTPVNNHEFDKLKFEIFKFKGDFAKKEKNSNLDVDFKTIINDTLKPLDFEIENLYDKKSENKIFDDISVSKNNIIGTEDNEKGNILFNTPLILQEAKINLLKDNKDIDYNININNNEKYSNDHNFEFKFVPIKNNYLQCKRCCLVVSCLGKLILY
jgi:hypothetical protein